MSATVDFARALGAGVYAAHSICLTGEPSIIWTFVLTNAAVFLSYFLIGGVLILNAEAAIRAMVRHRNGFGAFIFLCGLTHLANVITLFWGVYRLEAVVMALTAGVSILTAYFVVEAWRGRR